MIENLSVEEQAKASYWWHMKSAWDGFIHPGFDWHEVKNFLVWVGCWILLPILFWYVVYARRKDAKEFSEQYRIYRGELLKED